MMAIGHETAGLSYGEAHRAAILEAMAFTPGPLYGRNEAGTEAGGDGLDRQSQTATREGSELGLRRCATRWQSLISSAIVDTLEILTEHKAVGRDVVAARIVAASKPLEIVAVLRLTGQDRLASRIEYLHGLVDDDPDEPPIVFSSLRELALFLVSERRFGEPEIGLSPDGFLQAEWSVKNGGVLVMNFLPDGIIQFAAVAKSVIGDDRSRRVNGMLPKDEALSTVRPFTWIVTT